MTISRIKKSRVNSPSFVHSLSVAKWLSSLVVLLAASIASAQPVVSDDSGYLKLRLVRAQEIQSANIISASAMLNSSGYLVSPYLVNHTAHVVAYTYRHMVGNDLNGDASNGSGGGGGGIGQNPLAPQSLVEEGEIIGGPGGGGGTGGGGTGGGGSTSEHYWISIPGTNSNGDLQGFLDTPSLSFQPYIYASLTNYATFQLTVPLSTWVNHQSAVKYPGVRVKLQPGQEVTVCYAKPALAILPSGFGQVMATKATLRTYTQQVPPFGQVTVLDLEQEEVFYDIDRSDGFEDTAVDSRKGYGQPNREGQFPADPNAELRNINFGDWVFKGGMFVGNMPSGSGDRSGTARFQLWEPTIESDIPRMTIFTVYQYGKPSNVSGAMTIGLFGPLPGPDLYIGEGGTTWTNKWDINPRAAIPSNGTFEVNRDPYKKFTIDAQAGASLLSMSLTKVYDKMHPSPGDPNTLIPKTTWETPDYLGLCLALHDEQTLVDSNWQGWRYFADKEFQPLMQDVLPTAFRDLAPRFWRFYIDESYSGYQVGGVVYGGWVQ